MSEFAKASPPSTNFIAGGTFEGSATPSAVVRVLFSFGSLGSLAPRSNAPSDALYPIHRFSSKGFFPQHGNALICSGTVRGQHGVSTGSGSDRVSVAISGTLHNDPVATAPGTDLILKLGHCPQHRLHN